MFNLISRSKDYSLQSLLGFNILKVPLESFVQENPSLTLLSGLYATGEPILALTQMQTKVNKKEGEKSLKDIAHDLEKLLHLNNCDVKISPIQMHVIDEDLHETISTNNLSILNNQHVFLESPISTAPGDIYDFVFNIQSKNLIPVINYPEMNTHFTSKNQRLLKLGDRGCTFHIDLLSLSGNNGQEAKKVASSLLQSNQVSFVSFQIHTLEHIKNNGIKVSRKIADLLDERLFTNLPHFF